MEIIHVYIWFLNKTLMFLTCIDKPTKHASTHCLADRNSITINSTLKNRFAIYGKPKKIIADNESYFAQYAHRKLRYRTFSFNFK